MTAPTTCMISTFGWSLTFLILSGLQPAARASPIFSEPSPAISAYEAVFGQIEPGDAGTDNEQTRLSAKGDLFEQLDDDAIDQAVMADPHQIAEILPQYSVLATGLGPNQPHRSGRLSLRYDADADDRATEHDVAVSLYLALDGVDENVARDLLTSYRAISHINNDVAAAINSAIGVGDESAPAEVGDPGREFGHDIDHYGIARKTIDITAWIRFLLSLDAVFYYVIIASAYATVRLLRVLWRRS